VTKSAARWRALELDLRYLDRAFRLGFNLPMGPLELGDFNGLDTFVRVLDSSQQLSESALDLRSRLGTWSHPTT
jgi:3-hydroxyacyl-CoA dehydrogenase